LAQGVEHIAPRGRLSELLQRLIIDVRGDRRPDITFSKISDRRPEVAQHLRATGRVLQDHAGDVARQLLKIGRGGPE
jgi:hypothetical protein